MAPFLEFDEYLEAGQWATDFATFIKREDPGRALEVAQKALSQAGNAQAKAAAFAAVARGCLLQKEFLKAKEAAESAVAESAKADVKWQVAAQRVAAKVYMALFCFEDATKAGEAAVACGQKSGNQVVEAAALMTRAEVCLAKDRKQEAAKVARQAVAQFKECQNAAGEGAALEVVARICLATKKGSDALQAANEALGLFQGGENPEAEARAIMVVSKTKQALGDFQEAMELAQKAVDIFDKKQEKELQAVTLMQLANICFEGGESIDGWQYAKEALSLFREVGHNHGEASMICQVAKAHIEHGSCEEAVRIAEEGVSMCKDANYRAQSGAMLGVIASAHMGQITMARSDQQEQQINWKARLAGKEALGILQSVGDRVGEAQVLKTLATAFLNYGNAAEARAKAKQAIEIGKEIGNKRIEGENLLLVAQTKIIENKEEGARLARTAEKLLREAGDSSAAKNAGEVYDFIRDYGSAAKDDKVQKKAPAAPADLKTDITCDVEEGQRRLAYFHGFTARTIRPKG
eukprot:TRINITY_DN88363_c0_g1_i1.p1 TRINITY_DN88363_c0_g1~~TRINITY_DN88363_c0_g1_i1.p1  ORF type:complete len:544 (+),score=146.94 TRINITY_DN88363_c0_g1_i1:67-1632(+)